MINLAELWAKRDVSKARLRSAAGILWTALNSPIAIALVSAFALNMIARTYSQQDEATKDLSARRGKLDSALTELQQRVSYLQSADASWSSRCNYMNASQGEVDAVRGSGGYVATSPVYKNVNISVVLMEAERSSGAPDPGYSATRWAGVFSARPPWSIFLIRAELPWLQRYVTFRTYGAISGKIPLLKNEPMTENLQKELGIPTLKEIEVDQKKENSKLMHDLNSIPNLSPCK